MERYAGLAFDAGYHTPNSEGQHNLEIDSKAIYRYLLTADQLDSIAYPDLPLIGVTQDEIRAALFYGVEAKPFEGVEQVLWEITNNSEDDFYIWTQSGNVDAQIGKIRSNRWDETYTNPFRNDNFSVVVSTNKFEQLERIIERSYRRGKIPVVLVEDDINNIVTAMTFCDRMQLPFPIQFVYMDHPAIRKPDHQRILDMLPPGVLRIEHLGEITEVANKIRQTPQAKVSYICDMDGTLVDPRANKGSRRNAVVNAAANGKRYIERGEPRFHPVNGIFVVRGKASDYDVPPPHAGIRRVGAQAEVTIVDEKILKILAERDNLRPKTKVWETNGGHDGAARLEKTMYGYYKKLKKLGMPVPEGVQMYVGRNSEKFFVVEYSPLVGTVSLEEELLSTEDDTRKVEIIHEMLDATRPVLLTEDVGADIKPKNFIRNRQGKPVYIDFLPVIGMNPDTNQPLTEWPPVPSGSLDAFLSYTHFTEQALAFRVAQELCQMDPRHRTLYKTSIWRWAERNLNSSQLLELRRNLYPTSSSVYELILNKFDHISQPYMEIEDYMLHLSESGMHPIYHIRDMAFALSECASDNLTEEEMAELVEFSHRTFHELSNDDELSNEVWSSVQRVPLPLKFLTIVRRLTHLSSTHYSFDHRDKLALEIIKCATAKLLSSDKDVKPRLRSFETM